MKKSFEIIIKRYNLNEDQLYKIIFSLVKLILYTKNLNLDNYEPEFIGDNQKLGIIHTGTRENVIKEIFKPVDYYNFRDYLSHLIGNIKAEDFEALYNPILKNDKSKLEELNNYLKNIEWLSMEEIIGDQYPLECGNPKARYCPVCQERPCMCSDPYS